jgi:PKD repeat protein
MDACRRLGIGFVLTGLLALGWSGTAQAQNADPTVTASRAPTGSVRVGVPIQFTAVGIDADSDTLSYAWTFGDNTTSTEQNPTKSYLTAGSYTATVTVSDGKGGSASASISGITIQANRNPTISVASATPAVGIAPFTTQLAATATDPDGHAITYAWDLDGDGTFESSERNPSLSLTTAGDKTPTLRVTDAFGGSATRAVPVTALAATPDPSKNYHVLVFSKTAAFRHGSIGPGITAIKQLGAQNNFGVDAIEDASLFTDEFLARYDAVIWLSTTGDVLNDAQQAAFERYIQGGGGYVGIHAAADTEYTWPWYGRLVGGYFRNHPNGTPTATVVREDPSHVSTAHLPERWTRVDEWYNFQGIDNPVVGGGGTDVSPRLLTPIHVLLTVDESTYNESDGNTVDDDHPVSWCKRFDGGRMFYTALGHTNQSFSEPDFLQHLVNGIGVAAGYISDPTCGIFKTSAAGDVGANVPATLALSLGSAAGFGSFVPGVGATYDTSTTANVISTAGDAGLSVTDPSATATGRLVNGAFALPQPLQVMAASAGGTGGAFAPLATDGAPLSLLTYSGPVSNDAVTVSFRQAIGANDALRTGAYSKTLTFTLSTTTP